MLVFLLSSPPLGQAWGWPREGAQELMTRRKEQERERSELAKQALPRLEGPYRSWKSYRSSWGAGCGNPEGPQEPGREVQLGGPVTFPEKD